MNRRALTAFNSTTLNSILQPRSSRPSAPKLTSFRPEAHVLPPIRTHPYVDKNVVLSFFSRVIKTNSLQCIVQHTALYQPTHCTVLSQPFISPQKIFFNKNRPHTASLRRLRRVLRKSRGCVVGCDTASGDWYVLFEDSYIPKTLARPLSTPPKPMKAMASRPATTRAMGIPAMPLGMSIMASCSRMAAKMVSARPKPRAVLTA